MDIIFNNVQEGNCTEVDRLLTRYFLPVSYSVIFLVGLVGNVASLGIYLTKLRPWKSSSVIMVNLAMTDLLYVLSMPFLVHYYSNGNSWVFGDFMCRFVRFGFHFNLYGSILFLTCLAVFRHVVVVKPLWGARVQEKTWGVVACVCVWVTAAAEVTPMLTMLTLEERDGEVYCLDFASNLSAMDNEWYGWVLTVLGFLLPLVVVFICYIGIVKELLKGPDASGCWRMRARRVTMLILAVFATCFLPYHVLRLLRIETLRAAATTSCMVRRLVNAAYILSRPLAGLNTFSNLALYTLSGDSFRRAFISTFGPQCWFDKARSFLRLVTISKAGRDGHAA